MNQISPCDREVADVSLTVGPGSPEDPDWFDDWSDLWEIGHAYVASVKRGLRTALRFGPDGGYPVVGVKVVLTEYRFWGNLSPRIGVRGGRFQGTPRRAERASPMCPAPVSKVEIHTHHSTKADVEDRLNRAGDVLGETKLRGGMVALEAILQQTARKGLNDGLDSKAEVQNPATPTTTASGG